MPETKIPCSYSWVDEYTEPSAVQVSRDGDLGVITIDGSGDGTLELVFSADAWIELANAMCDIGWDLMPHLQENPEEG